MMSMIASGAVALVLLGVLSARDFVDRARAARINTAYNIVIIALTVRV